MPPDFDQAEETQEIPVNMEGGGILEPASPVSDEGGMITVSEEDRTPEESNPLDSQFISRPVFIDQLMNPPALRFTWHGKDISGNEYSGQGATTQDCLDAAAKVGAVTCHMDQNPDFIEPEAEILPDPNAKENNAFYAQGFADGDAAYQDVKTLILAWVSDQMLSSNPGFAQEVESLPFVTYVRYNR